VELVHRALEGGDAAALANYLHVTERIFRAGLQDAIASSRDLLRRYEQRYGTGSWAYGNLRAGLATLLLEVGQIEEAEAILLELFQRPDKIMQSTLGRELGMLQMYANLLCSANRPDECLAYAQKGIDAIQNEEKLARAFRRQMQVPAVGASAFYILQADAYMQQGRWHDAVTSLSTASRIPAFQVPILTRTMVALLKQPGREAHARTVLELLKRHARIAREQQGGFVDVQNALLEAVLLLHERRYAESREVAQMLFADKLHALMGDRAVALRDYVLAASSRNVGDKQAALANSRSAVLNTTGDPALRAYTILGFLLDDRAVVEENLLALGNLDDPAKSQEGFTLLQITRNGEVSGAISQMAARFSKGDSEMSSMVREQQDLTRRIAALRKSLFEGHLTTAKAQSAVDTSLRDIKSAEEVLTTVEKNLAERFPEYMELTSPKSVGVAAIQPLLRPDQALLSWFIGKEASWGVVVRSDRIKVVPIRTDINSLSTKVATLRRAVDLGPDGYLVFPAGTAHDLYQALIAPLMPELKGVRHLYVVPDSPFSTLPLSLLLTSKPAKSFINPDDAASFKKAPWLIWQFAIGVLPSVSSLRALRRIAPDAPGAEPFLGIGDPLLLGHPARPGTKSGEPHEATARSIAFRGTLANVDEVSRLLPLPDTAEELERMGRSLSPTGGTLKLRDLATEREVKTEALARYRVIAMATHGLVAGEFRGLAEPGLVLTPPPTASVEDDGVLTASEVAKLKLNAEWVLLSACNTASNDGRPNGEGMSGLAKAFFYAGARTLMVSHWRVPSRATVELTTDTVEQAAPKGSRAEAHRSAMLRMIESGDSERSHPSAWASFVIVGVD
jgi:CHAT domain-containing protein